MLIYVVDLKIRFTSRRVQKGGQEASEGEGVRKRKGEGGQGTYPGMVMVMVPVQNVGNADYTSVRFLSRYF